MSELGENSFQAISAAAELVKLVCDRLIKKGILIEIVKKDPYVLGYVFHRIASATQLAVLEFKAFEHISKIHQTVGWVIFDDDLPEIIELYEKKRVAGEPNLMLGSQRAAILFDYAVGEKDIRTDPDFNNAMLIAPDLGLPLSEVVTTAISALEVIWFMSYIERY